MWVTTRTFVTVQRRVCHPCDYFDEPRSAGSSSDPPPPPPPPPPIDSPRLARAAPAHPRVCIATIADLLLLRFVRTHGVRAMSHWEASPFDTKDGQDVVKAKGPHVVSEGWERVASGGGASSGGSFVASLAAPLGVLPLTGDGSSTSLPHWQKAFLLLVGGFVVFYIRRLLRSQRRPARAAAVSEVDAPACTSLHRPAPPPRTGPCTVLRPLVTSPLASKSQKISSPDMQEQLRAESQGQGRSQRVRKGHQVVERCSQQRAQTLTAACSSPDLDSLRFRGAPAHSRPFFAASGPGSEESPQGLGECRRELQWCHRAPLY